MLWLWRFGGLECCLSVEWIVWIEMDGIAHVGWALYMFFGEYDALLVLLSGSKWVVGVGCRVQTLVLQRARFGGRRLVLELNPDDRIGSKVCGETQCSNWSRWHRPELTCGGEGMKRFQTQ